jgi:hypothetical protein
VTVKNLRTIKTAKSTYQLVGAIDRNRLEKENVFKSIASHFSNGFPADWKELILRHSKGNNHLMLFVAEFYSPLFDFPQRPRGKTPCKRMTLMLN